MSFPIYILLTSVGDEAGPFDIYSDSDNYVTPVVTNVPSSALTQYYTLTVPDGTTAIRIVSEGTCTNSIDISVQNLPTPSVTPTNTATLTPTPAVTQTNTPSITPSETPTNTPTVTNTNTPGLSPTQTQTQTGTPTNTPTNTPTVTPTQTPPSGGILYVYARYVNSSQEFGYVLNGGPYIGIGTPVGMSCDYVATISGLQNGDTLIFQTIASCGINGDTADCPNSITSCSYTHNFVGTTYVYITVDGSNCC